MLQPQDIVCFAPDPWDAIWRNRHQIMTRLARRHRVLYVEPRPYLRPTVSQWRAGTVGWGDLWRPALRQVQEHLHVYRSPLYAPLSGRPPLSNVTAGLRQLSLRGALRHLGFAGPILWLTRPDQDDVIGLLGERLLVYQVVDEYSAYADLDPVRAGHIRAREQALLRRADVVLVTSRALLESKGPANPQTHLVPNAVDFEAFQRVLREDQSPPPEFGPFPRPIIGYVGAINDKIDLGLLAQVARHYPRSTLVLVGPVSVRTAAAREELAVLQSHLNVHFLGRVEVAAVPRYMAHCDVALLPYRRNEWTRNISSLKLLEYLALGLPVVAVDLPMVEGLGEVVYTAANPEAFVDGVARALAEEAPALRARRQALAAGETWEHRVAQIESILEAALAAGKRPVAGSTR